MEATHSPEPVRTPCDPARYDEVRAYLERLLSAPAFSAAPRRARLLKYLLDRTLSAETEQLNEYSIGIDVFDKLPSFDPRSDSMVRTDIMRLRQRLRQYYAEEGRGDPVLLDLPPRSYRLTIQLCDAAQAAPAPPAEVQADVQMPAQQPRGKPPSALFAVAALAVAAICGLAWWQFHRSSTTIQSLVVLPFQDFSSARQSGYLADGLTDEITNDLANLNGLRVIARTTAFEFKGKGIDVREIGRQLNVEAALEGSIDREGERIRIRAQLNRTTDGYHLWSHVYDVQFRDLIAVQRDIARSIANDLQLSPSVSPGGSGDPPKHDPTPEAHELYLRGTEAWNAANLTSFQQGAALFQSAVDRDPEFAQAWLALANAHWNVGIFSAWSGISVAQVESEAKRALDLDPGLASAHATLGSIFWRHDWDWPRAESEFHLALQYGAGSYNVHNMYAGCLAERGFFADSHRQLRIAQELSPLQDVLFTSEAALFRAEGRLDEAERTYQKVLAKKPDYALALSGMAGLRLRAKDCNGAAGYAAKLAHASPGSRYSRLVDWALAACRGDSSVARQIRSYTAPSSSNLDLAAGYAALGDRDGAIEYLQKSAGLHEIGITAIKINPFFEPVHSDARFIALERQLGM